MGLALRPLPDEDAPALVEGGPVEPPLRAPALTPPDADAEAPPDFFRLDGTRVVIAVAAIRGDTALPRGGALLRLDLVLFSASWPYSLAPSHRVSKRWSLPT